MSVENGYNTMPCDKKKISLFQWRKTNVSWIRNHTKILLLTKHEAVKQQKFEEERKQNIFPYCALFNIWA